MKTIITYVLILSLCLAVALGAAIVEKSGEAPYYVRLAEAMAAAGETQLIVVKFETDW